MLLDSKVIREIEGDEESFVPPFPKRATTKRTYHQIYKDYQENSVGVFGKVDYTRRILRLGMMGKELILCNEPDLVQDAFATQHDVFQQKSAPMQHALKPLIGDGLFISDRETWSERRGVVAPIIHTNKVASFAPTICETILEWRDNWMGHPDGSQLDILFEMAELTAEIISRTVFGSKLGREHTAQIVSGFKDYQAAIPRFDVMHMFGIPDWVPRPYKPSTRRPTRQIHEVVDGIIERHLQSSTQQGDDVAMVRHLFDAKTKQGKKLTKKAIRNEAIVIFMAGHETTANTLAWAWYNISQSARVRKKFLNELEDVLGGQAPTFENVRSLAYTRSIIEETLRLYPPVPLLGRRALREGTIDGKSFKKGTSLLVSPWLLHRNPNLWSKPDSFIPERFDSNIAPRPNKYAYIPFAIGPRICPGLTFGLTEAILSLATLGQSFELKLKDGHKVETDCKLTLRPGSHLPMTLHRR